MTSHAPPSRRYLIIGWALLLALCGLFIVLRWTKLNSLWNDPARWLFEAYRSASGEVVYRDFAWQFPPLSLLMMGGAFRLFGATFEVAQVVLDALGVIIVGLTWSIARRLLSPWLALATTLAFTCAMGSGGGPDLYFFSLQLYTPAQLIGLIGILLLTLSLIDYLQSGVMTRARWLWLSIGSTISLLSKPEFAVGALAALIALMLIDARVWFHDKSIGRWLRRAALIGLIGFGPALIVYLIIGGVVGFDNLISGVTGYGAAALICPWWPTGISAFGALAALGQGALLIAVVSLVRFNDLKRRYGRKYLMLWIVGAIGFILTVINLPVPLRQTGYAITLNQIIAYVIAPGTVLLPVLWWSIVWWIGSIGQWLRVMIKHQALSIQSGVLFVLWTMAIAMSSRSLFGDSHSLTTMVALAPLAIWFIVWPYLLIDLLRRLETSDVDHGVRLWSKVVLTVVVLYGGVQLIDGLITEARTNYVPLQTEAGTVRLADHPVSADVYQYVVANTRDHENILDVAYGGGINFAARRGSPVFSTQWWYLIPAQKYADADYDRFMRQPPSLIIGNDLPHFAATFGVEAATACTFPRLVWRPDELAYDPMRTFPVIDSIEANYQPAAKVDGIVIFERQSAR